MVIKWRGSERTSSILDHNILNDKGENSDGNEPTVVADVLANVEFSFSKLTCIELVKELHEYEALEDNSVKLALFCCFANFDGIPLSS